VDGKEAPPLNAQHGVSLSSRKLFASGELPILEIEGNSPLPLSSVGTSVGDIAVVPARDDGTKCALQPNEGGQITTSTPGEANRAN
jgi:hypothetical protein